MKVSTEPSDVWRDDSPPAYSTSGASHPAWYFTSGGRNFGPYYSRHDAEQAKTSFEAAQARSAENLKHG